MKIFADACNYALSVALEHHTANKIRLQKLCYAHIRSEFGLTANLTIQAIRRVAASYKAAKAKGRAPKLFRPTSVSYDQRIFAMKEHPGHEPEFAVSLSTIAGRLQAIPRHLLRGSSPKAATLAYNSNPNTSGSICISCLNGTFLLPVVGETSSELIWVLRIWRPAVTV